ncbi:trifunctional histidinol dehydrogenase [Phlyctochytrium planicorne]|nr:trifunctional histidinol dehydrogenase [Phlyctochytrium planicorne]
MYIPIFKDAASDSASASSSLAQTLAIVSDIYFSKPIPTELAAIKDITGCWQEIPIFSNHDEVVTSSIASLDGGASKVVFRFAGASKEAATVFADNVLTCLPADRVMIHLDFTDKTHMEVVEVLAPHVSGLVVKLAVDVSPFDGDSESDASSARKVFDRQQVHNLLKQLVAALSPDGFRRRLVIEFPNIAASTQLIAKLDKMSIDLLVPSDEFESVKSAKKGSNLIDIADAFSACLVTDRTDGLFPTMVVDEQRVSLGLAYSSIKSVAETIKTGQGVYQSRSRGLWYKGLTSGATQTVKKITFDCDKDTLQFVVDQKDPGYCHLNTRTCFGHDSGITALGSLLRSRKISAPKGSYTRRLFDNPNLLNSKIMEEAQELCEAETQEDIAWECADLLYFALAKCANHGVTLSDIERQLDRRSKKVTRRPGNAKPHVVFPKASETKSDASSAEAPKSVTSTTLAAPDAAEPKLEMKMAVHSLENIPETSEAYQKLLKRPILKSEEIFSRVRPIISQVAKTGDKAITEFTQKFDNVKLESTVLKAPFPEDMMKIEDRVKAAIDTAYENIRKFHEAQLDRSVLEVETMPGVVCSRFYRPIERVGLYVPGGTAVLPSSTLMLGVPAKVAGCSEIVIASPPRKDGTPVPEVVYVASKVGASTIVLAGGAQAVAAMAYGTESVPKVDKICGPGNQYVTAAKMLLQNDASAMISIDMPAGPSELLVIADNNSTPSYVASDLLSQAEHGEDSQVVLVAVDITPEKLAAIEEQVKQQGLALPRCKIADVAISHSYIIQVKSMKDAIKFSNDYAPEHLILHVDNPDSLIPDIVNAGSVFIGEWSPESCGDYASGTNHTLPTYGYARMYSGVNTTTFVKHITSQKLTKEGLNAIGDTVTTLAEIEGLEAHRNAVAIRLKDIRA